MTMSRGWAAPHEGAEGKRWIACYWLFAIKFHSCHSHASHHYRDARTWSEWVTPHEGAKSARRSACYWLIRIKRSSAGSLRLLFLPVDVFRRKTNQPRSHCSDGRSLLHRVDSRRKSGQHRGNQRWPTIPEVSRLDPDNVHWDPFQIGSKTWK